VRGRTTDGLRAGDDPARYAAVEDVHLKRGNV
jgi:hypothetical protein